MTRDHTHCTFCNLIRGAAEVSICHEDADAIAFMDIQPVNMEFRYGTSFGVEPPEAYERLLLDCMVGDQALFTRGDEVEASWRWISRVHEAWAASSSDVERYEAGTWGPEEADRLLARDGHQWRRP